MMKPLPSITVLALLMLVELVGCGKSETVVAPQLTGSLSGTVEL